MKKLIFIFLFQFSIAQFQVSLLSLKDTERLFSGMINGKTPITLYLKFKNNSQDHLRVFSVEGWYYQDDQKKKIPLVGICNQGFGMNEFTLYNFPDTASNKKVLDFKYSGFIGEEIDKFLNMTGFTEKFFFNIHDKEKAYWKSDKKSYDLEIFTENLNIYNEYEILQIKSKASTKNINLNLFGVSDRNFKVIKTISNTNGLKILMKFNYNSNFNIQGKCGTGQEIGYLVLDYNKDLVLQKTERLQIQSCINEIESTEIKSTNKNELKYSIKNAEGNAELKTIDLQNVLIK